jgi:histidinol-phosphate phosphatase family protein
LLLLDRDGTVLRPGRRYVLDWSDVKLQDGAAEAIAAACEVGFAPALVTNQACVNRGLTTTAWVVTVNEWIAERVRAAGGADLSQFVCPHVAEERCGCRKPRSGLLHAAAARLGLPLETAWYVGDSPADFGASREAGVARFLHVCSSAGRDVCAEAGAECLPRFRDLAARVSEVD